MIDEPAGPEGQRTNEERRGFHWALKSFFVLAIAGTALAAIGGGGVYWYFSRDLPDIITVEDYRPLGVTRVLGNGGQDDGTALLGEFFKERRYLIPYEKMPPTLVQAFVSAEDDQFFDHQGINLTSIIRASIANFKAGQVVQGGSTITQQVAKSLLLTPERSFNRKFKEIILASRIESNLTKEQILYLYLNQIYLGHGAYGVQAAARAYFKKDVSELSVAESALLAGLPQAPSKYSPLLNPKRAKERQQYVLRRMYESGHIDQRQMAEAAALPLKVYESEDVNTKTAPYLVEHIRKYLVGKYGDKAVYEGGMTIAAPVPMELARAARSSLEEGLRAIDKRQGYRGPVKKLKSLEEIEQALKSLRLEVIRREVGYTMFTADGQIDPFAALQEAGATEEWRLLKPGRVYGGVVTSVDDKRKVTGVMLGSVKAELPFSEMEWATRGGRQVPSAAVAKGDLIRVRVVKAEEGVVTVGLDQEPQVQGALFSLDAKTGAVLAMEGGFDFATSEFNRAIQAQRQVGSAIKPIIFSSALERGFTPASIIVDSPIVYEDAETGKWKPTNFEEKFYGDTTLRQALVKSRNVPTIKIVQAIQIPNLIDFMRRIGLDTSAFNADLSIALGSSSVSLMDLTRAYALYPRLGRKVDPVFISWIQDRDGRRLEERTLETVNLKLAPQSLAPAPIGEEGAAPPPAGAVPVYGVSGTDPEQVLDPRVSYVMTHLMNEVVLYGTGQAARELGRISAGKTGTTNDYIDAWFMGFTPSVVTGVWVGNDSQKPIGHGETGARAALPIWLSYMKEAVKNYTETEFPVPSGVVFASIDPATGRPAPSNSSRSIREAFIEGTQPDPSAATQIKRTESQSEFLKEDIE